MFICISRSLNFYLKEYFTVISLNLRQINCAMHGAIGKISIKKGTVECSSTELDLAVTLQGGQSFRWTEHENGHRGVFAGCVWTLFQSETHLSYIVEGSLSNELNYSDILSNYFRLDVSLEKCLKEWSEADEYFVKSSEKAVGVRILNQDVIENLFSFICSSNNNIQRISGMVEKLCTMFGNKLCVIDGKEYFDFPTLDSLLNKTVESTLREQGFGYRAAYIANAAKQLQKLGGKQWLLKLHKTNNTSYLEAREQLLALSGVGPKVADCVCLMSLGHLEAIPVDTHIFQVARKDYLPHLENHKSITPKIHEEVSKYLRKLWGPLAGWAQAVIFCAKIGDNRKNTINKKRKNLHINLNMKRTPKR